MVRLIAATITPIVSKSRFLHVRGARAVVSNQPHLELQTPTRHRCRTTLLVKQSVQGFPLYRRAHLGYLHMDFKAPSMKYARTRVHEFLQLSCVGQFTTWGYGSLQWVGQKLYHTSRPSHQQGPRFRILKGLLPNFSLGERQLVMAALLHDLVDTALHPSKLVHPLTIPDSYVQWLCAHHHNLPDHPRHADLQLLQEADMRASGYARLLQIPTPRRKLAPFDTAHLAHQLEAAAQRSIYKLYSGIYHSDALHQLIASKAHPTETLRRHLIGVANWTLFLLRTRS